jgi:hypothetical protein
MEMDVGERQEGDLLVLHRPMGRKQVLDLRGDRGGIEAPPELDIGADGVAGPAFGKYPPPGDISVRNEDVEAEVGVGRGVADDPADDEIAAIVDVDRAADGRSDAEVSAGSALREDDRIGHRKRGDRISFDGGEGEHPQERRVHDPGVALVKRVVADPGQEFSDPHVTGGIHDLGDRFPEGRGQGDRRDADVEEPPRVILVELDPIEGIDILVEPVEAELVKDPEGDQDGAGQAEGQPGDVEKGIALMPDDIPQRDFEVVPDHHESPDDKGSDEGRKGGEEVFQVPASGPSRAAPAGDVVELLLKVAEERGVLEGSGHMRNERRGKARRARQWGGSSGS